MPTTTPSPPTFEVLLEHLGLHDVTLVGSPCAAARSPGVSAPTAATGWATRSSRRQLHGAGDTHDLVSEELKHYLWGLATPASPKAALDCIAACGCTDFRSDLERIDVPTLLIHGDSDAIVPLEFSGQRTARDVKGAQLHVVEGGPHGITAAHAEEFNRVLLGFLGG